MGWWCDSPALNSPRPVQFRRITRGEKMKAKLVEHAIDMLEAAKATHDPAKIAKAQALLDMVRGWV